MRGCDEGKTKRFRFSREAELVLTASSFGTAGILVITMIGLYSRIGGSVAAVSALLTGLILTPLATYVFRMEAPFMTSVFGSLAAFAAGTLLAKKWGYLPNLWLSKLRVKADKSAKVK